MNRKKVYGLIALLMALTMTACGQRDSAQLEEAGQSYLEKEDYEDAAEAFSAALETEPETEAYIGLIRAYSGMQDYASAASAVDEAFDFINASEIDLSQEELDDFAEAAADAYENLDDAERQYAFWTSLSGLVSEDSVGAVIERGAASLAQLGQTYMEEEDYGLAADAWEKAIELAQSEPDYYLGLAESLIAQENYQEGIAALENGYEETGDGTLEARIEEAQEEWLAVLTDELADIVDRIEVQYTVDDVQLGVTEMEEISETYGDWDGVKLSYFTYEDVSHLSTVMSYYGKNGNEVAEGYEEGDIDFYFESMYVSHTVVHTVEIANPDFLCAGSLRVGDDYADALELYGLEGASQLCVDGSYTLEQTEGGKRLYLFADEEGNESFWYYEEDGELMIEAVDGKIHKISMTKY
ncbi:MAG: tetratricopeptide repeat protein [Tannerellaceae bacterium]|nr:tetratricopeptide repeat protein [Tannerellaceae bacterium]